MPESGTALGGPFRDPYGRFVIEVPRGQAQVDFLPNALTGVGHHGLPRGAGRDGAVRVFMAPDGWSLAYAVAGAATATAVTPALAALLAPSGGHPFTWPFVLVTLVFPAAAPAFSRFRRVPA